MCRFLLVPTRMNKVPHSSDEVAEWLRRWTANPMCSARVGSNPILVVIFWGALIFQKESEKGSSGIRTRDLSHPKRESYP